MAQDKDMQNQACRDYLANTSPAAWSYEGWLDYWRLHSPVVGYPDEIMYIDEARFQELRRTAARAQGIEEPGAQEPRPTRKKAQPLTEEQKRERIEECRARIAKMPEYREAVEAGWIKGFRWTGGGKNPLLYQWLKESGIATQMRGESGRVSWNIVDGVFERADGTPVTVASLSASNSQKGGNY